MNLETMLIDVGASLDIAAAPDLVAPVHARIAAAPPRRRARWAPVVWTRRSLALAAALLVLTAGIAVGSYLGVRGVSINPGPPPTLPPGAGTALDLGARTTLAGARSRVAFPVRVPRALGAPDEVYIDRRVPGTQVTLLYRPRVTLPEANATQSGLLLFEFEGTFNRGTMEKFASPEQIHAVAVGRYPGFWVAGVHEIAFRNANGDFEPATLRLSDSALLWQIGTVTFRIESSLSLQRTLDIATSLR